MPEPITPVEPVVETPPVEPVADEATPVEEPPVEPVVEETPPSTLTLEQALAEVKKTNGESANYRVRAREAEKKLAEAKTLEEVAEIIATMTSDRESSERGLLVENVVLKHNLPEALAARLVGNTREELEADAAALAALIPKADDENGWTPPNGGGGLSPLDADDPDDGLSPGELAKKYGRGRRNR